MLAVNTRIGIVGGGPSGLSAAYALAKLGYSNVTMLEKHHTVGGMCESVEIEGKNSERYLLLNLACYVMDNHYIYYSYRKDL